MYARKTGTGEAVTRSTDLSRTGRKTNGPGARNFRASRLKVVTFDEQKDDMVAYLERHERFATRQQWDGND